MYCCIAVLWKLPPMFCHTLILSARIQKGPLEIQNIRCHLFRLGIKQNWMLMAFLSTNPWCTDTFKEGVLQLRGYSEEWSPKGSLKAKTRGPGGPNGFWPRDFQRDSVHHYTPKAFPHIIILSSSQTSNEGFLVLRPNSTCP